MAGQFAEKGTASSEPWATSANTATAAKLATSWMADASMPATALDARLLQMTITAYITADMPPHARPHGESAAPCP